VARYTRQQGCAGVVCGHIHVPAIREIDGIAYYNCGDWVEHCSALVEHVDGRMELVGPATAESARADAELQAA
jgi:UDP-2,3-diacylglucosamine pyrophosphatase LpxH